MIITDKFVLLAFPKTGTSYTTRALRIIHARRRLWGRIYPARFHKRTFYRPDYREQRIEIPAAPPYNKARSSRHGTYRDIPEQELGKTIVSVMRNPFSRYTSAYLYQTRMRKHMRPIADVDLLKSLYPTYPELSFAEYYDMSQRFQGPRALYGIEPAIELGIQTVEFIHCYFRNPEQVLRKIDHNYIASEAFREDMPDVRFLHQESLREEFCDFLLSMGYSAKEVAVAENLSQVNVARREQGEQSLSHFYNPELAQTVLRRDALIFKLFPEYAEVGLADNPPDESH